MTDSPNATCESNLVFGNICDACPLKKFKTKELFSPIVRNFYSLYIDGFDGLDIDDPVPDPDDPAYLYDFAAASAYDQIAFDASLAAIKDTDDNKFILAALHCFMTER